MEVGQLEDNSNEADASLRSPRRRPHEHTVVLNTYCSIEPRPFEQFGEKYVFRVPTDIPYSGLMRIDHGTAAY